MAQATSYVEHIDIKELKQNQKVDSLLETLRFLSKYYQRAVSKESLILGFPIHENGMTIVVTHKMALLTLVDRVIIIDNGKIVADGPKEKVLAPKREG